MSDDSFARQLGFLDATAIGMGTTIGGGIYVLPSIAAARAGPASAVSFAVAGVASLLAVPGVAWYFASVGVVRD